MGPGQAIDHSANVANLATLDRDVEGRAMILNRQGGGVVASHVGGDQAIDGEIGDDIAIVDQDGIVADPLRDVFDASARFKEDGFVKKVRLAPR